MRPEEPRQLDLTFALGRKGRSELVARHVSYPWSVTQPFYEADDAAAYVIPQSASGGLYARENVRQRVRVGAGAAVLMRTQGATLVHRCAGTAANSMWNIAVDDEGRAELLSDLIVLGPGAALRQTSDVTLSPTARLVLTDGWTWLLDEGSPTFSSFHNEVRVCGADGHVLARERIAIASAALNAQQAMVGQPIRALGTSIVAGPFHEADIEGVVGALSAAVDIVPQCWTGIGLLPNHAGVVLRAVFENPGRFAAWSTAIWRAVRVYDGMAVPSDGRRGI